MNHVIMLAGGVGSRLGADIPKQYLKVGGKPVVLYSFEKFAASPFIDSIVMVVADEWRQYVSEVIAPNIGNKQILYASAGRSRQHSILNGMKVLEAIASDKDIVLVHDSVRPLFPLSNIADGIAACSQYDGALPVITVKDATYQSKDGVALTSILPRNELFSGQSPECFLYGKYLKAHYLVSDEMLLQIRGSSELAFRTGMSVKLIQGTERNFKITTIEDLNAFEQLVSNEL